jgi:uncharacterized protein YecE (DUF72 family)
MVEMNFHVGTSGYSYAEWKGKFYPKKFPADQMLPFYAQHFSAVEINNTFYRMPQPPVLKAWAEQVPRDFTFSLKAPQRITHFQRLKNARGSVSQFLKAASVLKDRLGPVLFGLPPNFKKDLSRLNDFLKLLPTTLRAGFEFRHESWFDDEVFDLLRHRRIALCIAQTDDIPDPPLVATADWGYLRLRLPKYSDADLKSWVRKIRRQKWKDAFVFFKHEEKATGPKFAKRFMEIPRAKASDAKQSSPP